MPNATATQVKKSNNPFDIFITGLRKGFNFALFRSLIGTTVRNTQNN